MKIGIKSFSAWTPNGTSYSDFVDLANETEPYPVQADKKPATPDVPASMRRRLSTLAASSQLTAAAALRAAGITTSLPIVFASRHGQGITTEKILKQICESEDEISQNNFIMSVHNSTCGVLSILQGNTESAISVASSNALVTTALIESFVTYTELQRPVLCIIADESVSSVFAPTTGELNFCFAAAFVIDADPTNWNIKLEQNNHWDTERQSRIPEAIRFLQWCFSEAPTIALTGATVHKSEAIPVDRFTQATSETPLQR